MKLYEIDQGLQQALDALEVNEETGEIIGMEAVEALQGELEAKLLAIGKYAKGLSIESSALMEESNKLRARANSIDSKFERLHSLIQSHIKPDQEIKDSQCVLKLRACPPSVRILDEKLLPPDYTRIKVTNSPDKDRIKQALKDGVTIPGVELITNYSLQIK